MGPGTQGHTATARDPLRTQGAWDAAGSNVGPSVAGGGCVWPGPRSVAVGLRASQSQEPVITDTCSHSRTMVCTGFRGGLGSERLGLERG